MIEAISGIVETTKEVAVSIEECRISMDIISDMRELLDSVTETTGDVNAPSESENVRLQGDFNVLENTRIQLDSSAEYVKGDHLYETDEQGEVCKIDGEYLTSYDERIRRTPLNSERGSWTDGRGESKYIPNSETEKGARAAEKLAEYGLDGIEYRDGIPDFSKCSEETVEIDMTENRTASNLSEGIISNYRKADTECANKWNIEQKDGRTDWTARQVELYRKDHKLSWHECADKKTCQLVSQDIHSFFIHSGGVCECGKLIANDISGGGFDV